MEEDTRVTFARQKFLWVWVYRLFVFVVYLQCLVQTFLLLGC